MIAAALLALVCLISALPGAAVYAVEAGEATLLVRQTFDREGTPPSEVFTYRLVPRAAAAPMPLGSNASGFTLTITGLGEQEIGPITFPLAGVFTYELQSVTADRSGYTIDRRVYTIEIYVTESLEVVVIYRDGDVKVSELLFAHSYRSLPTNPTPAPPPTLTPTPQRPTTTPSPAPEGPKGEDAPKTGDDSDPALWMTLIVISSVLLLLVLWIAWRPRAERRRGS